MDFKKFNGSWGDTPVYKYCKTNGPNLVENNLTNKTANGLTITVNGNAITVNGTATANTNLYIYNNVVGGNPEYQKLGKGKYIIDGNPSDAAPNAFIISMRYKVEAYKRENGAWTAEPTNGRRLLSIKKPITEELDPDEI